MENEAPVLSPQPMVPQAPPVPAEEVKKGHNLKPIALVLIAISLVLGSGAGLYFGLKGKSEPTPTPTPILVQAEPAPELSLSLTSPTIDTIADGKMLKVSGVTLPDTPVVFLTENFDNTVQSDETGAFDGEIELESGVNTLTVTAMADNGDEKSVTREIVFDDRVLGVNSEKSKFDNSQGKKFVQNNVEMITKLYQVDKNTKYADEKNKPLKSNGVKLKDKAIAIIENGEATPPGQLKKALKIFIRSATDSAELRLSKRRAVQGAVASISGSTITLTHQTQRDRQYQVIFSGQTKVIIKGIENPTPADILVGQRIVATGNVSGTGAILATRIFVIPGKATGLLNKQPVTPFPTSVSTPSATLAPSPTLTPAPSITSTPSATPTP
jgi:hypothetical protein